MKIYQRKARTSDPCVCPPLGRIPVYILYVWRCRWS